MKVIKKGLNKKKGFTLVELSIVLVIVGLLVSGIIVAQSLIETAQLHGFVRQIEQYRAAVNLFEDRFRSLPGDSTKMNFPGDGDGIIWGSARDDIFDLELGNFWYHMSTGIGLEDFNSTGISTGVFTIPDNAMPIVDYGNGGQIIAATVYDEAPGWDEPLENEHVFWVIDPPSQSRTVEGGAGNCGAGIAANEECDYPFTPLRALAFDQKTDDGMPNSGNVRAAAKADFGVPWAGATGNTCVSSYPTETATYRVDNDYDICALSMRIFPE